MSSKAEKVEYFIRQRIDAAVAELAIQNPGSAEWLRNNRQHLGRLIIDECTGTYDLIELNDIMHWKKPKGVE